MKHNEQRFTCWCYHMCRSYLLYYSVSLMQMSSQLARFISFPTPSPIPDTGCQVEALLPGVWAVASVHTDMMVVVRSVFTTFTLVQAPHKVVVDITVRLAVFETQTLLHHFLSHKRLLVRSDKRFVWSLRSHYIFLRSESGKAAFAEAANKACTWRSDWLELPLFRVI